MDLAARHGQYFSCASLAHVYVLLKQDGNPDLEAAVKPEVDCGMAEADENANVRRWKEEIDMLLVFVSRL